MDCDTIKVETGKKTEAAAERVALAERAGPEEDAEVEGQAATRVMECPWCRGLNRVRIRTGREAWACAWCGKHFY
jgi:hypothetical protein